MKLKIPSLARDNKQTEGKKLSCKMSRKLCSQYKQNLSR